MLKIFDYKFIIPPILAFFFLYWADSSLIKQRVLQNERGAGIYLETK